MVLTAPATVVDCPIVLLRKSATRKGAAFPVATVMAVPGITATPSPSPLAATVMSVAGSCPYGGLVMETSITYSTSASRRPASPKSKNSVPVLRIHRAVFPRFASGVVRIGTRPSGAIPPTSPSMTTLDTPRNFPRAAWDARVTKMVLRPSAAVVACPMNFLIKPATRSGLLSPAPSVMSVVGTGTPDARMRTHSTGERVVSGFSSVNENPCSTCASRSLTTDTTSVPVAAFHAPEVASVLLPAGWAGSQHSAASRLATGQSVGHTHTASAAFDGSTEPVRPSIVMEDPAEARRSTRVLNDTCMVFSAATKALDWLIWEERKSATSSGAALRAARASVIGTMWM
mmetsp:Transcript_37274/g.88190  ORF Transcript_37274/g.88190 Transcript_37274/m.88190 type:complete len:344 (-) Transcript_37274:1078-2109(-)